MTLKIFLLTLLILNLIAFYKIFSDEYSTFMQKVALWICVLLVPVMGAFIIVLLLDDVDNPHTPANSPQPLAGGEPPSHGEG